VRRYNDQDELENEFIRKAQGGCLTAFEHIVRKNQNFAYNVAFKLTLNEEDTKDAVQETFIRVWKNIKRFNFDSKFTTWFYKILVNTCYDSMRAAKRRKKYFADLETVKTKNGTEITSDIEKVELVNRIAILTENLTMKQRIVFILRDFENLNIKEISELLNMSHGSVKTNLSYARKNIKEMLLKLELM
jgi:RNA polymerase sigma-70 factor (ECF subfamily)